MASFPTRFMTTKAKKPAPRGRSRLGSGLGSPGQRQDRAGCAVLSGALAAREESSHAKGALNSVRPVALSSESATSRQGVTPTQDRTRLIQPCQARQSRRAPGNGERVGAMPNGTSRLTSSSRPLTMAPGGELSLLEGRSAQKAQWRR